MKIFLITDACQQSLDLISKAFVSPATPDFGESDVFQMRSGNLERRTRRALAWASHS